MKLLIISLLLSLNVQAANERWISPENVKKHLYQNQSNDVKRYKARGLQDQLKRYCEEYLKGTYNKDQGCWTNKVN